MAEQQGIWGAVAAIGSLLAGATTVGAVFFNNSQNQRQIQPVASPAAVISPEGATTPPAPAPAAAAPTPATLPAAAPQAPAQPQPAEVRQASLSAQDHAQLQQLVRNYLDNVYKSNGQGTVPAPGFSDELVSLQPNATYRWQVNLNGGAQYRVIGACDNECTNVDIEVADASGRVLASDVLPDDYPVVTFTAPANGAYQVRIIMRTCTIAPCYAGARLLIAG